MGLLRDLCVLVTRRWHYARTDTARTEREHWLHDLVHGADVGPKEDATYTLIYMHISMTPFTLEIS
jgi:hypothetical protein